MKLHFPQLSKQHLYEGISIINPVVGAGLLMQNEYKQNPQAVKSTIQSVHETIKTDVGQGVSTLGKGVQGGSKILGSAFNSLMLPLTIISGLIIAILVLKK